jgi:hypothetical protein
MLDVENLLVEKQTFDGAKKGPLTRHFPHGETE